jgi:hypothetical protein
VLRNRNVTVAVVAAIAFVAAGVWLIDTDHTSVIESQAPEPAETLAPTSTVSPGTTSTLETTSTTRSVATTRNTYYGSTIPLHVSCAPGDQIRVPCPITDGEHLQVQSDGLPPGTWVQFGLCLAGPSDPLESCTPGVVHQTAPDPQGRLLTPLTFERVLLIDDRLVDCAYASCELRVYVKRDRLSPIFATRRQPLVFTTERTRTIVVDDANAFAHRGPRAIEIRGINDGGGNADPMIAQCVRQPPESWQSNWYEACIGVPVSEVRRDGARLTALIAPSRWSYEWAAANPPGHRAIDCSIATRPCYLRVSVSGEPGVVRLPMRVSGQGAPARLELSRSDALADRDSVTLTLIDLPPRRFGSIMLCLDPQRREEVPPPDGDGVPGCIVLRPLPATAGTSPQWPDVQQQIDIEVPRFIDWHGTRHDCADPRGCELAASTGSWCCVPDFAVRARVQFAP